MQEDPDHQPVTPEFRAMLNALAETLDEYFNPTLPGLGTRQRKVGFFLTCFNFNETRGRFNYISNADKLDVKTMLKDIVARIEAREKMDAAGPAKGSA